MANAATLEKPTYLGLLNAISLAESAAGVYLEAWANVTPNEDLACTLRLVAARERSHGEVFCRRIAELGFSLRRKTDPRDARRLARLADPKLYASGNVGEITAAQTRMAAIARETDAAEMEWLEVSEALEAAG